VLTNEARLKEVNQPRPMSFFAKDGWLYRRVVLPVVDLLRMGASPERLAWSIAVGLLVGINPLLGSTTILCLAAALLFRLDVGASQLGNHIVYPLELLLFVPFLHLGSRVFHTPPLPLSRPAIVEALRQHPAELVRRLWLWEWHALILWAVLFTGMVPVIAIALTPLLRRLMERLNRREDPIAS
jgi:uncharacterized protein (DUF2062 family)